MVGRAYPTVGLEIVYEVVVSLDGGRVDGVVRAAGVVGGDGAGAVDRERAGGGRRRRGGRGESALPGAGCAGDDLDALRVGVAAAAGESADVLAGGDPVNQQQSADDERQSGEAGRQD